MILENHSKARAAFPLPAIRPVAEEGVKCDQCVSECQIGDGDWGWCGINGNENGRMVHRTGTDEALLSWYLDPHVTNCCNSWWCPGGTGRGHPDWCNINGSEYGFYNMSLFLYGCSFNCLFCQNWQHKRLNGVTKTHIDELVETTLSNEKISCWCWFGGSPEPQLPFTVKSGKRILAEKPDDRIMRICYEWNGSGNTRLALRAAGLACESGGNIKFDAKAWSPVVHEALTGLPNQRVFDNIKQIYDKYWAERSVQNPVLGITTLLVPYYVGVHEVESIAKFLASIDREIPYSLLIFHPDFKMDDLPVTPRSQVQSCMEAAERHLSNVNLGNKHLLNAAPP